MRKTFIFICLLFSSIQAFSQSPVVSMWDVDWTATRASMTQSENQKFEAMPQAVREKAQASFETRSYHFQSNGNIQVKWGSDQTEKIVSGTWSLEGNVLTIVVDGSENTYTIEIISNVLTLTKTRGKNMVTIIILNKRV